MPVGRCRAYSCPASSFREGEAGGSLLCDQFQRRADQGLLQIAMVIAARTWTSAFSGPAHVKGSYMTRERTSTPACRPRSEPPLSAARAKRRKTRALPLRHAAPTARWLRVAGSADRKETTVHWQHYRGWRAPLPRRKSTNPPANSCDGEVTLCGSNCWRLRFSLENRSTLIPAVTADLPGLLRVAACTSEIAVIEPPYAFDERRVAPFTLTHDELNSLRPIHQPRQRRKSVLFGFSMPSCSSIRNECGFCAPQRAHALFLGTGSKTKAQNEHIMSAFPRKRTDGRRLGTSALCPKADIGKRWLTSLP